MHSGELACLVPGSRPSQDYFKLFDSPSIFSDIYKTTTYTQNPTQTIVTITQPVLKVRSCIRASETMLCQFSG